MKIRSLILPIMLILLSISCQKQKDYAPELNSLQSQIDALVAKETIINSLQTSLLNLSKRADSLSSALVITNNKVLTTGNTVTSQSALIISIQTQITTISTQITSLSSQLTTSNANVTIINTTITNLTIQLNALQVQINTILSPLYTLPTSLKSGLLLYYPFSGNANDASGNGYSGTVSGAVLTTDRNGIPNSAYQFTANSDVISVSNSSLNPQVLSLSLWFKLTLGWTYTTTNLFSINNINEATAGGFITRLDQNNNSYGAGNYKIYSAINNPDNVSLITPSPSYPLSQFTTWNNLIIVRTATQLTMYLNGTLVSANNVSAAIDYSNTVLQIGNKRNLNSNPLGGRVIDDVLLYNRALTADEISYLATH
jgi:hypothetical protein